MPRAFAILAAFILAASSVFAQTQPVLTISFDDGMLTSFRLMRDALRIRVSISAMGSVTLMLSSFPDLYHDALTMPGISPLWARSRKHKRHMSNFR